MFPIKLRGGKPAKQEKKKKERENNMKRGEQQ